MAMSQAKVTLLIAKINVFIAKAVMIGKVHHGLIDGMGTLMLLASIDGNKNLPAIPKMKDVSAFKRFILFLLSPIFFIYCLYVDLLVENDPNPYTLTEGFTGKKQLAVSRLYDFTTIRYSKFSP